VVDTSNVESATGLAEQWLAELPVRLAHVRGVADATARITASVAAERASELIAAGWLHDIGYAPGLAATGFHPIDGARFVRAQGFPDVVVSLVAFHTGAEIEANVRGLDGALDEFARPPLDMLDLLTFADLTTGPAGEPVRPEDRLAEVLARYGPDDPVHRSILLSRPGLLEAAERARSRLGISAVCYPR
jgi:hypothetical protein